MKIATRGPATRQARKTMTVMTTGHGVATRTTSNPSTMNRIASRMPSNAPLAAR